MKYVQFGEVLRVARAKAGLSKVEIARLVERNLATVQRWENGVTIPHRSALSLVASAYRIDLLELSNLWRPLTERPHTTGELTARERKSEREVTQGDLLYLLEVSKGLVQPMTLRMIEDLHQTQVDLKENGARVSTPAPVVFAYKIK